MSKNPTTEMTTKRIYRYDTIRFEAVERGSRSEYVIWINGYGLSVTKTDLRNLRVAIDAELAEKVEV